MFEFSRQKKKVCIFRHLNRNVWQKDSQFESFSPNSMKNSSWKELKGILNRLKYLYSYL